MRLSHKYKALIFFSLLTLFLLSFFKIHIKIQTIMIGYEIGRLKDEEILLLKKRSFLMLSLAQLTTKDSLSALIKE
jgi:hypothetical protein